MSAPIFSSEQLHDLAVRGATIDERLGDRFEPLPNLKPDVEAAGQRLAAWCQSAAGGDWSLFAKRLRREGLSMDAVMPRLSAVRLSAGAALPRWVEDATWLVPAMLAGPDPAHAAAVRNAGDTQPFDALFVALVAAAERRRDAGLPAGVLARLGPGVREAMAHWLLAAVAKLCAVAVFENFAVCRQEWAKEQAADNGPTRHYDRFIAEMRRSGLRRMFDTKPVLLRLLAALTRQWMDSTSEFLTRLHADMDAVRAELLGRAATSPVVEIKAGLSDPHNAGRSVHIIRFADGGMVVYKPKDTTIDARWAAMVDWLNARRPPIDLRAARVVLRPGYGWCEFIAHGDCADRAAAERFFRRAGGLLCLWHLVAGTDMHEENMIAAGEYPVGIDLEMLLQARDPGAATGAPDMRAFEAAQKKLNDSVLTTGLLPSFLRTPETAMLASGGLNDAESGKAVDIAWAAINTDAMQPDRTPPVMERAANLPRLGGARIKLPDYVTDLQEGCAAYYRFVLGLKAELLAADGPVATFADAPIRRVLKPTRFYFMLLDRIRNHRDMRDGAMWSAHLDFVSRLADWDKETEALWPLFASERRALGELNIPFFVHPADSDRVQDGAGTVAGSGLAPGLAEARQRIAALDEGVIAWQLDVVRLTTTDEALLDPETGTFKMKRRPARPDESRPLDRDSALASSRRIATRLAARAIRDGDGAAWIGLDPLADGGAWGLTALGCDLYGGAPGIAIFLAAHARLTGDDAAATLARAALAPSRYAIHGSGAARFGRVLGIGGASGLGSLVYALTTVAKLLDDATLRDDARRTARLLTDDVIASDKVFDTIGGAAGCLLGLLRLYRDTGDAAALERAIACGQHLLRHRPPDGGLWRHLTTHALAGMSHGAAGFAYALSALGKASGRAEFTAAARDCLAYERGVFSPERNNWPDLREAGPDNPPSWPVQWCHGAGGVGLARVGLLRFGDAGAEIRLEIEAAVASVRRAWPSAIDTLCCGNLGNAEFLAEAGRTLGRDDLTAQADARVRGVIDAAETSGVFGWNAGNDDENLGLFRGLAGVGYTLLRRVAPDVVPNILFWE